MSIINASDVEKWNAVLNRLPKRDIYFTAEYHKSFETSMQRQARLYMYEDGDKIFFQPIMVGEILDSKYSDIETVYGYTGPLSNTDDLRFMNNANEAYKAYCVENNIICQIERLHPLLTNEKLASAETNVVFNRKTVAIELTDKETLWKNYHPKLRNDLVRAQKLDLKLEEKFPASEFKNLYEATMKRVGAGEFYIFQQEHYDYLQNNAKIMAFYDGEQPVAAAIFLTRGEFIHYHLAASADSPHQAYASKLLLHKMAEWGIDNGYKTFHLGGGRTAAEEDNLLFFKKRFGGTLKDFYIGKTIFDQKAYTEVCDNWRAKGGSAPASFLQMYRLPIKP